MVAAIIKEALMITSFVLVMMLIIEYVNVLSRGNWSNFFNRSKSAQLFFSVLLGLIPGCMGSYAVVSLYTHHLINFASLSAAMVTTFGDEAFILLGLNPLKALQVSAILMVAGIVFGFLIHLFGVKRSFHPENFQFKLHDEYEGCCYYSFSNVKKHLKNITFERAILLFFLALFIFFMLIGDVGHAHQEGAHAGHGHGHGSLDMHGLWVQLTFMVSSFIAFIIVLLVPEHFLHEHLWGHIIKKHFPKIFIWIIVALFAIELLLEYIDVHEWIKVNQVKVLIVALLIGLIPVSGPHLVFLTLFVGGSLPMSVFIANSIVQEGHGGLPLLAESRKSFFLLKGMKLFFAAVIGFSGFFLNW